MSHLVSVIIPCYNAENWLREAIDSVISQTYSPIEIIVIDDGSKDSSLDIIKSYGDRVIWETGPNCGGNHARNRGFALSKGEYIQYLDADDYLKPEKIERQVHFLEETNADIVYGDWQHQYHEPDGKVELDKPKISGAQNDILASLLAGWWVSPACILLRRNTVEACGGWDEDLSAGQDKDFFLSTVISGALVKYQPGCHSIYRRYGNTSVSTSSKERYLTNHVKILEKYEQKLASQGKLNELYKDAIAQNFFVIARKYFYVDRQNYKKYIDRVLNLSPNFAPQNSERTATYNLLKVLFGFKLTESLTMSVQAFIQKVRKAKFPFLIARS